MLHLLSWRFLQYLLLLGVLASKKDPCYFCDFCDICGLFEALLGLFSLSTPRIWLKLLFFLFLRYLLLGTFSLLFLRLLRYLLLGVLACKKNSCYFCDVCGLFEVLLGHFFISKSGIWLKLLLLFLRYLLLCILSRQEKSLLLLRFLRHSQTFRRPSWLLLFLSLEFCYICYFRDFCDICHRCF